MHEELERRMRSVAVRSVPPASRRRVLDAISAPAAQRPPMKRPARWRIDLIGTVAAAVLVVLAVGANAYQTYITRPSLTHMIRQDRSASEAGGFEGRPDDYRIHLAAYQRRLLDLARDWKRETPDETPHPRHQMDSDHRDRPRIDSSSGQRDLGLPGQFRA